MSERPFRLLAVGAAVALATTAVVLTASGWPARLPLHLTLFVGAGLLWAAALALLPRIRPTRYDALAIAVIAVAIRVPAWIAPPAHSDDVYRFAWDGRVTLAGVNPYRYAPAAPELAWLRDGARMPLPEWEREPAHPTAHRGPLWARINNADLPTIYPPFAQAAFALAALLPLPPVSSLKLLFALCDLAAALLLAAILRRRGADPRRVIAWAWSPLVAVEIGQNAHLDALPIALVVGAFAAWLADRKLLAGLLLGLATGAKLVPAPLVGALRSVRVWLACGVAIVLVTLPFASARGALAGSTGEFARRWRSNDGAYALVQAATDRITCRALHAPPVARDDGPRCTKPLDLWPDFALAEAISGRTYRAAVYPDELSSFAARVVTALVLLGIGLAVLIRRPPALVSAEILVAALVLLTPALHPWYALWLLPFAALTGRRAWIALAALVPLGYLPLAGWLEGAPWRDPIWGRLVEHGLVWSLLAWDLVVWVTRRKNVDRPVGSVTIGRF